MADLFRRIREQAEADESNNTKNPGQPIVGEQERKKGNGIQEGKNGGIRD